MTIIFLLTLAASLVATTIQVHLQLSKKQIQLMKDFEYEWNKD